jgi:hypothetical protein
MVARGTLDNGTGEGLFNPLGGKRQTGSAPNTEPGQELGTPVGITTQPGEELGLHI